VTGGRPGRIGRTSSGWSGTRGRIARGPGTGGRRPHRRPECGPRLGAPTIRPWPQPSSK
jgi:hypothetical protein